MLKKRLRNITGNPEKGKYKLEQKQWVKWKKNIYFGSEVLNLGDVALGYVQRKRRKEGCEYYIYIISLLFGTELLSRNVPKHGLFGENKYIYLYSFCRRDRCVEGCIGEAMTSDQDKTNC